MSELKLTSDEKTVLELHQLRIINLRQQLENAQLKVHALELETEKHRTGLNSIAEEVQRAIQKEVTEAGEVKRAIEERLNIDLAEYRLVGDGLLEKVEEETAATEETVAA